MLYHLFDWFDKQDMNFPGSELYRFITFRVLLGYPVVIVHHFDLREEADKTSSKETGGRECAGFGPCR
jgi:hypothetical protein